MLCPVGQIGRARRLCGTHERRSRFVGVDETPDMEHMPPQLFGTTQPIQFCIGGLGCRAIVVDDNYLGRLTTTMLAG